MLYRITVLLTLLLLPTAAGAFELPDGDWELLVVDGIEVYTDAGAGRATEIARQLSALRRTLNAFAMIEVESGRQVRLFVFKNRERFVRYLPRRNGKVARLAGYTSYSEEAVQMAVQGYYWRPPSATGYDGYQTAFDVLSHEYVHAYLGEHAPQTPVWLNEGLAEFFSTYRLDDGWVYIGEPVYYHVHFFERETRSLSLARLLMLDHDDPEYNESNRNSFVYAQSWSTTHYLMTDKARRSALLQFMRDVHDGVPELAAVNRDLVGHLPPQGPALREYVTQDHLPYFKIRAKDDAGQSEVAKSDLDEATLCLRLGELLTGLGPGSYAAAQEHFRACLDRDPGRIAAQIGLARVELYRADYEAAIAALEAAVEQDPEHCGANGMLGYALIQQYEKERGAEAWTPGTEPAESVLRARTVLERSCREGSVPPWASYAYARSFLADEDPTPGIEVLEAAIAAAPWEPDFFDLMVLLHCQAGNFASAREVYDRELRPRTRSSERQETEMRLVRGELGESRRMVHAGDLSAAATMLIRAFEMTESDAVRSAVVEQTTWLGLPEAYRQYLAAVRLTQDGQFTEALTALEAITESIDDPALIERTDSMRRELESLVAADLGR